MTKQKTKSDNGIKSANGSKPTKKRNPNTQDGRARRMVRFHLDISRDDDYELQKQIIQWKEGSLFLPMLRKAFWLLISLMSGSIELLAEYFPGIIEAIRIDAIADMEARNMALQSTIDQQEARIAELEAHWTRRADNSAIMAQLDSIQELLQSQGKPIIQDSPNTREIVHNEDKPIGLKAVGNSGPKQLAVPQFAAPSPLDDSDDDETDEPLLVVTKDLNAGKIATSNFLKSILELTAENPDKPKPDYSKLSPRQRAQMEGNRT